MKKAYIFSATTAGLFGFADFVFAQALVNPLGNTTDFKTLLLNIASGAGTIVASLGTLMVIIAGIMFLLSAGSPEKMKTARTALIYAVVGIVVGLAAYAIVNAIKIAIGV